MIQRHVNPKSKDRTATAPYNFVPLPQRIFTVADGINVGDKKIKPWENHDRFISKTHSGWIDIEILTITPLYIRGTATQQNGTWDKRDLHICPEPYKTTEGFPAIPGSSLHGMIRTLAEILSFSKIKPVSKAKPFFRTVGPDRIGKLYTKYLQRGEGVQAGFIAKNNSGWAIRQCEMFKVKKSILQPSTHIETYPNWLFQQRRCWFQVTKKNVTKIEFEQQSGKEWRVGTLVLTGSVPNKKHEFVFLDTDNQPPLIKIPENIWCRFHDDDQLTQWQKKAFPKNKPSEQCRRYTGYLREEEPVFFITDKQIESAENPNGLLFLGRAGMFRFPYDHSPAELVPQALQKAELDLAEAMFGKVENKLQIKGRVYFDDAIAINKDSNLYEDILVPQILSSPNPTTFQHYLIQDGAKDKEELTTYIKGDHTTIRGHKLYWHRWDANKDITQIKADAQSALIKDLNQLSPTDTQHTIIKPIKTNVTFKGKIHFKNLTDLEIGALLFALQLPDGCCHKIGMGKPLGLGSIQISARLNLIDTNSRYHSWQSSGVNENNGKQFCIVFEKAMLAHAHESDELLLDDQKSLRKIARLDALYRLLEWKQRPRPESTRYMKIESGDVQSYGNKNEFHNRPVLPSPHAVAGLDEPLWRLEPPLALSYINNGSDNSKNRKHHKSPVSPIIKQKSLPRTNDLVDAQLLEERTKKGGWRAIHAPSGLSGPIQNSDEVPTDKKAGDTLKLIVANVSGNERELAFRIPTDADLQVSQRAPNKNKKHGGPKKGVRRH